MDKAGCSFLWMWVGSFAYLASVRQWAKLKLHIQINTLTVFVINRLKVSEREQFANGLLYASQFIAPKGVYFSCNSPLRSLETLLRIIIKLKSSERLEKHVFLFLWIFIALFFSHETRKSSPKLFFFWENFNGLCFLFCWTMKSVIE